MIKALLTIALILYAHAFQYDTTLDDVTTENKCIVLSSDNCNRCYDTTFESTLLIHATPLCYQCKEGEYYWAQGKCVPIPDHRDIPGWGRTCAECGPGNFWSVIHSSCRACSFEAAGCKSTGSCCSDTEDFDCTNTFSLDPDSNRCACSKGIHFKLFNKCYCVGLNDVYMEIDDESGSVTCEQCNDKCHAGCENFNCPEGTYLDGCKCLPVHYTCKSAPNDKEDSCIECKAPFEFLTLSDNTRICTCPCCMVEDNMQCVENSGVNFLKNLQCSNTVPVVVPPVGVDSILQPKKDWLLNLIGFSSLEKIYQGMINGFTSSVFHTYCDNITPLIIAVSLKKGNALGYFLEIPIAQGNTQTKNNFVGFDINTQKIYTGGQYNEVHSAYDFKIGPYIYLEDTTSDSVSLTMIVKLEEKKFRFYSPQNEVKGLRIDNNIEADIDYDLDDIAVYKLK